MCRVGETGSPELLESDFSHVGELWFDRQTLPQRIRLRSDGERYQPQASPIRKHKHEGRPPTDVYLRTYKNMFVFMHARYTHVKMEKKIPMNQAAWMEEILGSLCGISHQDQEGGEGDKGEENEQVRA